MSVNTKIYICRRTGTVLGSNQKMRAAIVDILLCVGDARSCALARVLLICCIFVI